MTSAPRHNEMRKLSKHLSTIELCSEALMHYDFPPDMTMSDIIVFALNIYDTPDRAVDLETLREVFTKSGRFGVVAIRGVIDDKPPYLHQGAYADSLESLRRNGLVVVHGTVELTEAGKEVGATLLSSVVGDDPSQTTNVVNM